MSMPKSYPIEILETAPFIKKVKKLLEKDKLKGLLTSLAASPEQGVIIPNTGGIRKMRWSRGNKGRAAG